MSKKYDKNNIFAKIIRGEVPCVKVYEDDKILAFNDISKLAPVHILVIPKGQYTCFADFAHNAQEAEVANFFIKVKEIAASLNLEAEGYRLITNNGVNAMQNVDHFHVHILAGKTLGGLLPK